MEIPELIDTLILLDVPTLSRKDVGRIIHTSGSATEVFNTPDSVLKNWGIKPAAIRAIKEHKITQDIESQIEFIQKHDISVMGFYDDSYPKMLRMCDDAPILLYGRGDIHFDLERPIISVVGTRAITPYGASAVEDIISGLSSYNPMIVSGLAAGVDVHAHRAALKHHLPTVGVLGQGLGTPLFPSENKDTAREMCHTEGCGIITEYNHLMAALPGLFPARNRIVAGMSMATIVIEAKAKGGALITARLAGDYNRDVFALPGRITDPCSAGCNTLIRENKAIILDSVQTIVDELSLSLENKKVDTAAISQTILFSEMDDTEKKLADILRPHEKLHIDELCVAFGMASHHLAGVLLEMELKGFIDSLPGKYYALASHMRG